MTTGDRGVPSGIEDTVVALRRQIDASPQDIGARIELAEALVRGVDEDPSRTAVAADTDEPIELLRTAAELAADEPAQLRAAILVNLGEKLTWRLGALFAEDPERQDRLQAELDQAIDGLRRAFRSAVEADEIDDFLDAELDAVLLMVDLLRLRFDVLGDLDDLSAAIGYGEQVLGALAVDDPARPEVLLQLGRDHTSRHDQQTDTALDDQAKAIDFLRQARGLIDDDDPGRIELAGRLGWILAHPILTDVANCSDEQFAEAVAELSVARQAPAPVNDTSDVVSLRYRLGMVRAFRYLNRGGDTHDLDAALDELSELADREDTTKQMADACHLTMASLEFFRHTPAEIRRDPELIFKYGKAQLREEIPAHGKNVRIAVQRHLDALSDASAADPHLSMLVRGLSAATPGRHGAAELRDALAWFDDAVSEFGALGVDNELAAIRANLRAALAARTGDNAAATTAADQVADAITVLDQDHPLRTITHDLLDHMIGSMGQARSAEGAQAATAAMERLLAELPDDHPHRPQALAKAGILLFNSMAHNRSAVSFDRIRDLLTQAVERGATDDANNSANHLLLGMFSGFQGTLEHDIVMLNDGFDLLKKAIDKMPQGHVMRSMIGPGLGMLLYGRAMLSGDLENYPAAGFYSRYAELGVADEDPTASEQRRSARALGEYLDAGATLARDKHTLDVKRLGEAIDKMTAVTAQLPDDDWLRRFISSNIDGLRVLRSGFELTDKEGDLASANLDRLTSDVDVLLRIAQDVPEGRFEHVLDKSIAAVALVGRAFLARDMKALDHGISMLGSVCVTPGLSLHEQLNALGSLSMGLWMRYQHLRRPRDLSNAIDRLEQAELLMQHASPDGAEVASMVHMLATCYQQRADPHRRDRERAIEAGMRGLHQRAKDVLLQTSSGRALDTALATSGEAATVARWCLCADSCEAAVHALEIGRAIVLHLATIDAGIPTLLREGGYSDLAAEWQFESGRAAAHTKPPWDPADDTDDQNRHVRVAAEVMANLGKVPIPGDLRHRVLAAVEGTETYSRLLDPPTVTDITAALTATGSSALVYLLPADELAPGFAVIIRANGAVSSSELPGLRSDTGTVFEAFSKAQQALQAAVPKPAEERRSAWELWRPRLHDVCTWAWTAAMQEVLSECGTARAGSTRLVLVPVGELGAVPWHAARRRVPSGEWRYACQDATITYASSARQFVDVAKRHKPALTSTPTVVRVSAGLPFASEETEEIYRRFYPDGTYLGALASRGDRATADRVRVRLPSEDSSGASLLHLGCHAVLADPPLNSFLQLAGSKLYVRDMLEQARNRPVDADGGLVVLAACVSDLTGSAYDESLTLATAFLAAGSAGVVGAKWAVGDAPTALFMVMFHHYLNRGYPDPATALRAVQRWMLDERHKLPDDVGHRLGDEMSRLDLTEPANWAAFTYQGQ